MLSARASKKYKSHFKQLTARTESTRFRKCYSLCSHIYPQKLTAFDQVFITHLNINSNKLGCISLLLKPKYALRK